MPAGSALAAPAALPIVPAMPRAAVLALVLAVAAGRAWAAESAPTAATPAPAPDFARVEVAPAKTSIYIGTVSLTMPAFVREGGTYVSAYTAKVFPYFFYNEAGRLAIDFSDAQLARLAAGETVEFTGRALRTDGAVHRLEGRAAPADALSGKLKVRVFVSARIELIFNTTYRFAPASIKPEFGDRKPESR